MYDEMLVALGLRSDTLCGDASCSFCGASVLNHDPHYLGCPQVSPTDKCWTAYTAGVQAGVPVGRALDSGPDIPSTLRDDPDLSSVPGDSLLGLGGPADAEDLARRRAARADDPPTSLYGDTPTLRGQSEEDAINEHGNRVVSLVEAARRMTKELDCSSCGKPYPYHASDCRKHPADPWSGRSTGMKCSSCMWFVEKYAPLEKNTTPCVEGEPSPLPEHGGGPVLKKVGRCRRHSPTMAGYPVVFKDDWCGDHKLDEGKV